MKNPYTDIPCHKCEQNSDNMASCTCTKYEQFEKQEIKKMKRKIPDKYKELNPNDVVFTPDWLAKYICEMFDIKGLVLEPCKGEGAFMKYLPSNSEWCEITDGRNFYDYSKKVDWIVTNPPYSDFNSFLAHSFELADNVVFLVPLSKMLKSNGTVNKIFEYGGIVSITVLPASIAGFPFGFPCGIFYIQKGYKSHTSISNFEKEIKCPICKSYDTKISIDFPSHMRECNACFGEYTTCGDITLDPRLL